MKYRALLEPAPFRGAPNTQRESELETRIRNGLRAAALTVTNCEVREEPLAGGLVRLFVVLTYDLPSQTEPNWTLHERVVHQLTGIMDELKLYPLLAVVQRDAQAGSPIPGAVIGATAGALMSGASSEERAGAGIVGAVLGAILGGMIGSSIRRQVTILVGNRVNGLWSFEPMLPTAQATPVGSH